MSNFKVIKLFYHFFDILIVLVKNVLHKCIDYFLHQQFSREILTKSVSLKAIDSKQLEMLCEL